MTVKTEVSRFQIHDELTAPDESAPLIKSIQTAGGAVSKFVGVLAESPAVLRAYTRMRSELRASELPRATRERIALAVAEYRERPLHHRPARPHGAGRRARPRRGLPGAQLHLLGREGGGAADAAARDARSAERPPHHLLEEAREAGWSDEEILEAVAELALAEFESLIASVAALPQEGDPAVLREAAA